MISARARRKRKFSAQEIRERLRIFGENATVVALAISRCRLKDGNVDAWPIHTVDMTLVLPEEVSQALFDMAMLFAADQRDLMQRIVQLVEEAKREADGR